MDFRPLDELIFSWIKERCREKAERQKQHETDTKELDLPKIQIMQKLTLPCSEAAQGLYWLSKLGYNHARIFPGYRGVAEDILYKVR